MKIKTLFVSLAVAGGLGIGLLGSSSAYAEKCHVTATYVNAVPAKNQPTPLKFASYLNLKGVSCELGCNDAAKLVQCSVTALPLVTRDYGPGYAYKVGTCSGKCN